MSKLKENRLKKTFEFCPYKLHPIGRDYERRKPLARSGHRIVISDDYNIYSFGGYIFDLSFRSDDLRGDIIWMQEGLLFKELWKFNLATQKWKKLKTQGVMPQQLASHSDVLIGDDLLVFGGTSLPFGECSSNSVHIINLKTLKWKKLDTDGEHPLEQYGQAIVLNNQFLYVVGGTTGYDYSMSVHCLDLRNNEWSELKSDPQPEPRYRHEIIIERDKIFVFGGGTTILSFPFDQIPVFDIKERRWETQVTTGTPPSARRCHGCVRLDDHVYISGGYDGTRVFSDIWALNLKTFEWRKLPFALTLPVYFHSAAASKDGQMCIFGGVTNLEENTRTNGLFSVWLKIPSLAEMCWQAFLFYVPAIAQKNQETLLAAGIPHKFVQRVEFDKDQVCDETTEEAQQK